MIAQLVGTFTMFDSWTFKCVNHGLIIMMSRCQWFHHICQLTNICTTFGWQGGLTRTERCNMYPNGWPPNSKKKPHPRSYEALVNDTRLNGRDDECYDIDKLCAAQCVWIHHSLTGKDTYGTRTGSGHRYIKTNSSVQTKLIKNIKNNNHKNKKSIV